MRKIVYYVATSIDGFISGLNQDISGFVQGGNGVEKYMQDLASFDTVIMGRNTYQFGYKFGLKPGQPAYQNMEHYIFSNSLRFEDKAPNVHVKKINLDEVKRLREQPGSDIYLSGGGEFAGWLLDNEQIQVLKIKLNPLLLGQGIKLFGTSSKKFSLTLEDSAQYERGLQIMTYDIIYPS